MIKLPHPRLQQLLTLLHAEPLPQEELARRLNVSTRTVRTDVATLNELIATRGAHLIHQRGSGYQLKLYNQGLFEALLAAQEQESGLPRTSRERVLHLQILLLTAEQGIKLDELADTWYLSRAALQGDMTEVRERLTHFGLAIDSRPRLGMRIQGGETAIRACLTQLLCQELLHRHPLQSLLPTICPSKTLEVVGNHIHEQLGRHQLRLADESLQQVTVYCAVALLRQASGHELRQFASDDITPPLAVVARDIYAELPTLTSPGQEEIACLAIQIQARLTAETPLLSPAMAAESEQLTAHLLGYIHQHYPYDLRGDPQLRADLQTHIGAMLLRVKYQIDADHFMVVTEPLSQAALFDRICSQLEAEDLVESGFRGSLQERERIVSTMLGDGIALPHSLGLLARRTLVYTVLAPQGIDWGNGESATLIFVLAIAKADYEEAMGLYDLFLALMNEKARRSLLACRDFAAFKALARSAP